MKARTVTAILTVMMMTPVWAQQSQYYDNRPKISVSGEAVVNVKPDKIVISFGIETVDANIKVAKQRNNEILLKTMAAVKECGIPEKEMQTDHLSIEPRWTDAIRREKFVGYFVRNTVVVTLSEVERVEQLVTAALEAGVNYIHGIDFETTELKKYREQARELALKAAKEKADKMAGVLGQSVGKPIQIYENNTGYPYRYWSSWYGWGRGWGRFSGASQVQVQADRGGAGEIADTVALGKLSVRANVSVIFELRER